MNGGKRFIGSASEAVRTEIFSQTEPPEPVSTGKPSYDAGRFFVKKAVSKILLLKTAYYVRHITMQIQNKSIFKMH